ncbi:MAG: LysR family transcriptional regulator, glycine cleavage system transcriptional activator [Rhodospirillaceae bacterium]|jgi:LysR family glycine cleavage system transcriptional activator|nr:LysR family transcriptional regulator, glycine cleavage system transcriptional activator [Rhodospirillaceae bacterium]
MIIRRVSSAEKSFPRDLEASVATAAVDAQSTVALRRLPPLNALRCFEVAARYGSFTKAAAELLVTPAAVGQQVRQLEEFMGVALFRRENRALALTTAGQACLPGIREGFAQLVAAVGQAKPQTGARRLTISVAPSFAAKWLLPRLSDFEARHPDIDVHVDASMPLVDLHDGKVDLAIRYGAGQYAGLRVERLLGEEAIPVCSPALYDGPNPLRRPEDLRHHTLLHDDSPDNDPSCPTWSMWLRAAGVHGIDAMRGPHFSQSSLVLEAAALGRGVALAKATIAATDLSAGRVVRLFEMSVPLAFAYYLVYSETTSRSPGVIAFRQWLLEQVGHVPSQEKYF